MGYVKTVTGDASVTTAVLLGSQLKTAKGAVTGLDFTRFRRHISKLGHKIHSYHEVRRWNRYSAKNADVK